MGGGVKKLEAYVVARLEGQGDREAARSAGYAGAAPPRARHVYEKALLVRSSGASVSRMLAGKFEAARAALRQAREWDEAARLAGAVSSGDGTT